MSRRGYDPDAVHRHLSAVADEVDELARAPRRPPGTLAATAAEQVRAILEAAETSAAGIRRQAEEEAQRLREDAAEQARLTRERATAQARERVQAMLESALGLTQRLQDTERELRDLLAQMEIAEREPSGPRNGAVAEPPRSPGAAAEPVPGPPAAAEPVPGPPAAAEPVPGPPAAAEPPTSPPAAGADDESARFVALNMALSGRPREETERYLSANFHVRDQRGLLDEVYASVGA